MLRLGFVLFLCLAALIGPAAGGAKADFIAVATLTGSQEVPANASTATGSGVLIFNTAANTLQLTQTFSGLIGGLPTGAHIHVGPPGVNGPIIFDFITAGNPLNFPIATSGTFTTTFASNTPHFIPRPAQGINTFADAINAIGSGRAYLNIHNATFPGGEIRGNIQALPAPPALVLAAIGAIGLLGLRRKGMKSPA
jgi:hypothetical protein